MKPAAFLLCLLTLICAPLRAQDETKDEPSPAKAHIDAGDKKMQASDFKGALADFEQAVTADPEYWMAYFGRALAKNATGEHKGAIADLDMVFKKEPPAASAWRIYQTRAGAKQSAGDYVGAEGDFDKAIELNPRNPSAHYARAQIRSSMSDFKGAIEDYSAFTVFYAQSPSGYSGRGQVKAWIGDMQGAMEDLGAAVYLAELLPTPDSNPLSAQGRVKMDNGKVEAGIEDLDRAVELTPDSASPYFSRALARFDLGKRKGALKDFRKCLELDAASHEYARFYVFLIRLQLKEGKAAAKELKDYLKTRTAQDDWVAKVIGYLCGDLDDEAFLKAAEHEYDIQTKQHLCEAHWYIAGKHLAAGTSDKATIQKHLQAAIDADQRGFIEHQSATWALKDLPG